VRASDVIMSAVMADIEHRVPPRHARVFAVVHEDNARMLALIEKRRNLNRPVIAQPTGSESEAPPEDAVSAGASMIPPRPPSGSRAGDPAATNGGHALGVGRRDGLAACASRRR
jgi:hypothetical protein